MAPLEARSLEVCNSPTPNPTPMTLQLPIYFADKKHPSSFWPFSREASSAIDLTRPRWPFVQQISPDEDVLTLGPTISVLVSEATPETLRFELQPTGARLRGVRRKLIDQLPCDRPPSRNLFEFEGTCLTIHGRHLDHHDGKVRNPWVRIVFFLDFESEAGPGARPTIATVPMVVQIMKDSHHQRLAATLSSSERSPNLASDGRYHSLAPEVPIKIDFDGNIARFPETFDQSWLNHHWPGYREGFLRVSPMFWFKKQDDYMLFAYDLEHGHFLPTRASVDNPRIPGYHQSLRMIWTGSSESKRLSELQESSPVSLVMSGCDTSQVARLLWNEVGGFYVPQATTLHIPVHLRPGEEPLQFWDSSERQILRGQRMLHERVAIVDPTYVCDPPEEDPGD